MEALNEVELTRFIEVTARDPHGQLVAAKRVGPMAAGFPAILADALGDHALRTAIPHPPPRKRDVDQAYRRNTSPRPNALTAGQIMTSPVITVTPDAGLVELEELLRTNGFRHLPVVDRDRKLVGILSDRDVLKSRSRGENAQAGSIMSTRVWSASLETPFPEAARLLLSRHISALPVLDTRNSLCGILTTSDILRAIVQRVATDLRTF